MFYVQYGTVRLLFVIGVFVLSGWVFVEWSLGWV